jgi:hypothetical protein
MLANAVSICEAEDRHAVYAQSHRGAHVVDLHQKSIVHDLLVLDVHRLPASSAVFTAVVLRAKVPSATSFMPRFSIAFETPESPARPKVSSWYRMAIRDMPRSPSSWISAAVA